MHTQIITCLNGRFLPAGEALLPVTDRGFRFGDGVFETIRIENGIPYQFQLHISRLQAGLAALRITPPAVDWAAVAHELLTQNKARDGFLRLAISRGVGSSGYLPDAGITPNWVMEYLPASPLPTKAYKLWRSSIARTPSNHKLAQGVASTLALMEARDHQCDEALMLNTRGELCEAASANLFWISGQQLFTPALSTGCLAGTTRAAVIRLASVQEIVAHEEALAKAEAVFITNVRLGVWPVSAIGEQQFSPIHPIIAQLQKQLHADYAQGSVT